MTTKGIIEKVEVIDGIVQYRVRMPLFHEVTDASKVLTKDLPLAIYPLPPHMEKTILRVGDVVYCTLEDAALDNVVILGLIPSSKIKDTAGSEETESKIAMEQVDTVSWSTSGTAELPYKTKILVEKDAADYVEKPERNYVSIDEIACLKGITTPLVNLLEKINETLEYIQEVLIRPEIMVIVEDPGKEE